MSPRRQSMPAALLLALVTLLPTATSSTASPFSVSSLVDLESVLANISDAPHDDDHISVGRSLLIARDTVLRGRGWTLHGASTSLSGSGTNATRRIMTVSSGATLELDNITFAFARAREGAALAVHDAARATVAHCGFLSNVATTTLVGVQDRLKAAVTIGTASNVTAVACSFFANRADWPLDASVSALPPNRLLRQKHLPAGAALHVQGGIGEVSRCSFTSNEALKGPALVVQGQGHVVVDACDFANNTHPASGVGTGTYALSNMPDYWLYGKNRNHTLAQLQPVVNGGAVFIMAEKGQLSMFSNCSFRGNVVRNHFGGAMYIAGERHDVRVAQSSFQHNTASIANADQSGGVMYVTGDGRATAPMVDIVQVSFVANRGQNGGVIALYALASALFNRCDFLSNVATGVHLYDGAGCLYNKGAGHLEVANCEFRENRAIKGGVYHGWAAATMTTSTFQSNAASNTCTHTGCSQAATRSGETGGTGGAFFVADADAAALRLEGCFFTDTHAEGHGGSIHIVSMRDKPFSMTRCSFVRSRAGVGARADISNSGGALRIGFNINNQPYQAEVAVEGCDFSGNAAEAWQTVPRVDSGTGHRLPKSKGDGGAVFIDLRGKRVVFFSCIFQENQAADDGGAMFVLDGDGGAVTAQAPSLLVQSTDFFSNRATSRGGAVALFGTSWPTVRIRAARFGLNWAVVGETLALIRPKEWTDAPLTQSYYFKFQGNHGRAVRPGVPTCVAPAVALVVRELEVPVPALTCPVQEPMKDWLLVNRTQPCESCPEDCADRKGRCRTNLSVDRKRGGTCTRYCNYQKYCDAGPGGLNCTACNAPACMNDRPRGVSTPPANAAIRFNATYVPAPWWRQNTTHCGMPYLLDSDSVSSLSLENLPICERGHAHPRWSIFSEDVFANHDYVQAPLQDQKFVESSVHWQTPTHAHDMLACADACKQDKNCAFWQFNRTLGCQAPCPTVCLTRNNLPWVRSGPNATCRTNAGVLCPGMPSGQICKCKAYCGGGWCGTDWAHKLGLDCTACGPAPNCRLARANRRDHWSSTGGNSSSRKHTYLQHIPAVEYAKGVVVGCNTNGTAPCPWGNVALRAECSRCPTGRQWSLDDGRSVCKGCVGGRYPVPSTGPLERCETCPSGRMCPLTDDGVVSSRCPAGWYQPATGATLCLACNAGTFTTNRGRSECDDCPSGHYAARAALENCTACAVGTFQTAQGAMSCKTCASGFYTEATGTVACSVCNMCQAGYQVNGSEICTASKGGIAPPTRAVENATAPAYCQACASGRYGDSSNLDVCHDCPAGFRSTETLMSTSCTMCQAGRYAANARSTVCVACPSGHSQPAPGTAACKECGSGEVAGIGALVCKSCPVGFSSGGFQQHQPAGGVLECVACAPGTYSPTIKEVTCTVCAAGQYSNGSGRERCARCDKGQAQATTGKSACVTCGPGLHASAAGLAACTRCDTDSEFVPVASGASHCEMCAENAVALARQQHRVCHCKNGYYQRGLGLDAAELPNATSCYKCPIGSTCSDRLGSSALNFEGRLATSAGYWRGRDWRTMSSVTDGSDDGTATEFFLPCKSEMFCIGTAEVLKALMQEQPNGTQTNQTNITSAVARVSQCRHGHTGVMCGSCTELWRPDAAGRCVPCSGQSDTGAAKLAVALVVSFLVWAALTAVLVSQSVGNHKDVSRTNEAMDTADDSSDASGHASTLADILVRMGTLTPTMQRVVALTDVFSALAWPSIMTSVLAVLKILVMKVGAVLAFISPCNLSVDIEEELLIAAFTLPWVVLVGFAAKAGASRVIAYQRWRSNRGRRRAARRMQRLKRRREHRHQSSSTAQEELETKDEVSAKQEGGMAHAKSLSSEHRVRQREYSATVKLVGIMMLCAKLAHPGISAQLLVFGVCESVGSGSSADVHRVMRAAVDVRCSWSDPVYLRVVTISIVGIVLITCGLPIVLAAMIYRDHVLSVRERETHAAEANEERHRDALGILHVQTPQERLAAKVHRWTARRAARLEKLRHRSINWIVSKWKPHLWWWFLLEMVFSLILISLLQLATGAIWKQYYAALVTAGIQAMLPALIRPHVDRADDRATILGAVFYFFLVAGRLPRYFVEVETTSPDFEFGAYESSVNETNLLLDVTFIVGLGCLGCVVLGSSCRKICRVLWRRGTLTNTAVKVVPLSPTAPTQRTAGPPSMAGKQADQQNAEHQTGASIQRAVLRRCRNDLLASVSPQLRKKYTAAWLALEQLQAEVMSTAIQAAARGHFTRRRGGTSSNVIHMLAEVGRTSRDDTESGRAKPVLLRARTSPNLKSRPQSRHRQLMHGQEETQALIHAAAAFTDGAEAEGGTHEDAAKALLSAAETFTAAEISGLHETNRMSDAQVVAIMKLQHDREHADYQAALTTEASVVKAKARKKSLKRGFLHHFKTSELAGADLRAAFQAVDRDGSGLIDVVELKEMYKGYFNRDLSEEDAQELMRAADRDGDGNTLSLQELQGLVVGGRRTQ